MREKRFALVGTVDGSVVMYDSMDGFGGGREAAEKTDGDRNERRNVEPIFASNRRFGRRRTGGTNGIASSENEARIVRTSQGHEKSVSAVAWYPEDASAFFSASFDGTVKLWDASRAEVAATYASSVDSGRGGRSGVALGSRIRDVSLSLSSHLNNDLVAVATDAPDVKLWDPGSNVVGMTLPKAHPGGCSKTAWSKENAFSVITCGFEGRCAVWDAFGGRGERRCLAWIGGGVIAAETAAVPKV